MSTDDERIFLLLSKLDARLQSLEDKLSTPTNKTETQNSLNAIIQDTQPTFENKNIELIKDNNITVENLEPEPDFIDNNKPAETPTLNLRKLPLPHRQSSIDAIETFDDVEQASSKKATHWEINLGIKWFSRIGIVSCLIAVSLLIVQVFPYFPPVAKLLLGWVLAISLFVFSDRLNTIAPLLQQVLQGGGLSIGYLCLFAMFFIPEVKLIDHYWLGIVSLLSYCCGLLILAQRLNVQSIASLALGYGYYTSLFSGHADVAYISTTLLNLTSIGIVRQKCHWHLLKVVMLLGWFITIIYWHNPFTSFWGNVTTLNYLNLYLVFSYISLTLGCLKYNTTKSLTIILPILYSAVLSLFYLAFITLPGTGNGYVEIILALVQFLVLKRLDHTENLVSKPVLWIVMGSFIVIATLRATGSDGLFNQTILAILLAAYSVIVSLILIKKPLLANWHRYLLIAVTHVLWIMAFLYGNNANYLGTPFTFLKDVWITGCGFFINQTINRPLDTKLYYILSIFPSFYWLTSLSHNVPANYITLLYILTGSLLLTIGFMVSRLNYRVQGIIWLLLAMLKIVFFDIAGLEPIFKTLAFLAMGLVLLVASYAYARLAKTLEK